MDRLTPTAQAALATVDGIQADVLDAQGRLIITPNPVTLEGQRNVPADLRPGESLDAFLMRHVPGIHAGNLAVYINNAQVPQAMWARVWPKHGTIIQVRGAPQRQALAIVAIAVLSYFTIGMGGMAATGGTFASMGGAAGWIAASAAFAGGSILINKVLSPKAPTPGQMASDDVYALSPGSNSVRQHEALPLLLGVMQYAPDYASTPYVWYEGNDQYAAAIFNAGLNVGRLEGELLNGDTALSHYSDVQTWFNGFAGMPDQAIPLYTNVDAVEGGEFVLDGNQSDWITRTSSANASELQIDIEGNLYDIDKKGGTISNYADVLIETSPAGAGAWQTAWSQRITHNKTSVLRRTVVLTAQSSQVDVRARITQTHQGSRVVCKLSWTQLRTIQPDDATYVGQARAAVRLKATGQLSGHLSEIKGTFVARSMPYWDGSAWVDATVDNGGISNPGAQVLLLLRGIYADDPTASGGRRLVAGCGFPDNQIDIEGLKAFMRHCAVNSLTHDAIIRDDRSNRDLLDQIALCGLGAFGYYGGRWGVQYAWEAQPLSGTVNMGTIKSGTFGLDINLARAADGIIYSYWNRELGQDDAIYVHAPGQTTMLNPSRITGQGVTTAEHAAIMARYHLAQSIYQYASTDFEQLAEAMDYTRMAVLAVSHDLTQWGYSGRLVSASRNAAGVVTLELDEPVPAGATPFIGVRVPGERIYRVLPVREIEAETTTVVLAGEWPADLDLPGEHDDNPAHDTIWILDFKAQPGARVRVANLQSHTDLAAVSVSVVAESQEFWDYVIRGVYEPARNESLLPREATPVASNLRVTEQQIVQGDTVYTELTVVFDVTGQMERAEIWAAPEGQDVEFVAEARTRQATWRISAAGNWLVQVRPYGVSRAGPVASLFYVTETADIPPWNYTSFSVQEVTGGLRRYVFSYDDTDPPVDLAGAEIRYIAGFDSAPDWDAMTPIAEGVHTAHFESVLPVAGSWTFALRARNTSGQLSADMLLFEATLGDNFGQAQTVDLTPPPAVTGLTAAGMLTSVQVDWDAAAYAQGHGHARTIIYAAPNGTATFADAKQVAEAYGGPVSFASDAATTWRVWAKHQSADGALSEAAAGPVDVSTSQDPAGLLDVLQGAIGRLQLTPDFDGEIADQQQRTETLEASSRDLRADLDSEGDLADLLNDWNSHIRLREVKEVVAGIDGALQGTWAVEMELDAFGNQVAGGFSLVGQAGQAGARIDFGVLANRFVIASPAGTGIAAATPFVVVTVPEVIGGETVPVGVYMEGAYIKHGTIGRAQIGNAEIDDAKIASVSASKLRAGTIDVSQYIQSSGYLAGESGWRINGDGSAEFADVTVRGTVYATAGAIGGWSIGSNYLQSANYVAGQSGVRLGSDGVIEANQGTIGGWVIDGGAIRTANYQAGVSGVRLGSDGALQINAVDIIGEAQIKEGAVSDVQAGSAEADASWVGPSASKHVLTVNDSAARRVIQVTCSVRLIARNRTVYQFGRNTASARVLINGAQKQAVTNLSVTGYREPGDGDSWAGPVEVSTDFPVTFCFVDVGSGARVITLEYSESRADPSNPSIRLMFCQAVSTALKR